jgi:glycosyltransferase involved in cell wall biosynthesis
MKRRIKVLRVVIGLHLGGVQQGVKNLFRSLDPERYQPIACALENDGTVGREIAQDGFEVIVLGLKGKAARPRIIYELARLMQRRGIDIVHGSAYHPSLFSRVAGLLARAPILINHEHGIVHHRRTHRAFINHWLGRLTQAQIAVSQAVRRQMISWYHLDPKKVEVIYNGVRPEFFQVTALREASRRSLGLSPETRVVGIVARLHLEKGFDTLFGAMEGVKSSYPLKVLIAGTGPHEEDIRDMAARRGLADKVDFLGYLRDIPELLAAMDVFVLPSLKEGFSNSILEAMAAGLPLIATELEPIREAVEPGVSGLLFPPRDSEALGRCLAQVLADPDLASKLGRAAQARVAEHFTIDRFGRRIQNLYDRLVRERIDPDW